MQACDRFETEGLLKLEQGQVLGEHFSTCSDCRAARAAYEKLQHEIRSLALDREPPIGWEAGVLAATRPVAWARPGGRWLVVSAALAAGLGALVLVGPQVRKPLPASIVVELRASDGMVHRTTEAHPGQQVTLRARTGGAGAAELRLYRDDTRLLLRCSTEPPCRREGDSLSASVVLETVGVYQPVLVTSERPIPGPGGTLDRDAGAAFAAGAEFLLGGEIRVQ